jgi:allophanate hydrolase subunit 1
VRQREGALIIGGDVEAIKAKEVVARQHATPDDLAAETEPELDQFMEAYHEVLVKFREDLTRSLQEVIKFLRKMEPQLSSLATSARLLHNIFETEHWWKNATPPRTSRRGGQRWPPGG